MMNEYTAKLTARYEKHVASLKTAKSDIFVVVPKYSDEFGEGIITSAFVETMQGGGYKIDFADAPYTYILPDARKVSRIMRKKTGLNFTYVSEREWHENVIKALEHYAPEK